MIQVFLAILGLLARYQQPISTGQVAALINGAKMTVPPTLLKVPFNQARDYTEVVGSASATWQTGVPENTDGTGLGLNVSVSSSTPPSNYVKVWVHFYGTTFGIRVRHQSNLNCAVKVDGGGILRVMDPDGYRDSENRTGPYNYETQIVTHTGLASGPHTAQVMFSSLASGTNTALLEGFICDEVAKAPPFIRTVVAGHGSVVGTGPAGATVFNPYNGAISSSYQAGYTTKVVYSNWSTSSVTLYICNGGIGISNATSATPSVLTTIGNHGLVDTQPVWPFGIGGTTSDDTAIPVFARITSVGSATTLGLYSDPGLTTPLTGAGAYTSGGTLLTLYAEYSIPAGGSIEVPFTQPVNSSQWYQFASAAGLTYLPFISNPQ